MRTYQKHASAAQRSELVFGRNMLLAVLLVSAGALPRPRVELAHHFPSSYNDSAALARIVLTFIHSLSSLPRSNANCVCSARELGSTFQARAPTISRTTFGCNPRRLTLRLPFYRRAGW
ncbi:hypothetical protein IG631_15601 [Alternaria alternata]|nr:hypothetical protein IG631_15601 [Alternaria alternata]